MRVIIIGGGISGLSLAYFLLEKKPDLDITVLESEKIAGGKIWTDRTSGFLCEGGVNGFLDNRPTTLDLAGKLGLIPLRSSDKARKRYLFSEGKLHLLPESPASFFSSNLISIYGRLRILAEIVIPKGKPEDESLADFARRRLGREAYEKLIDPMASGIYAGDPEKMSLKSCFRRIYELEQEYGSLIRAMIRLQKEAKRTGRKVGAGPGGVLTSFYDGMGTLIKALEASLGKRLKTGARAVTIDKKAEKYVIYIRDGSSIETEVLVLTTPAYETSEMLRDIDSKLSAALNDIFYPAISVVCLGYKRDRIRHSLDGFGFLIPYREGRRILGTLWDSSIFPNRAPEDHILLRSMLGGARASELALQDEVKQVNTVMEELADIMGINSEPDFAKAYVHVKGIPQYSVGHEKKLEIMEKTLERFKRLYITGNAYKGIGVNDCIENSYKLAERIVGEI
ncbi:MAG: protoporphyrinogen oxidase [Nitrospirota bacterium]